MPPNREPNVAGAASEIALRAIPRGRMRFPRVVMRGVLRFRAPEGPLLTTFYILLQKIYVRVSGSERSLARRNK